ncbi:hypothetical protein F4810DRAFT_707928 [Camillea tinctor]|nr:hypothetical protein F4810DRAFT_707928 [Camillea tinctor]
MSSRRLVGDEYVCVVGHRIRPDISISRILECLVAVALGLWTLVDVKPAPDLAGDCRRAILEALHIALVDLSVGSESLTSSSSRVMSAQIRHKRVVASNDGLGRMRLFSQP